MTVQQKSTHLGAQTIIGKLSGKTIVLPDVNTPPMLALAPPGVIQNGTKVENFDEIDSSEGYPDVRSFSTKFAAVLAEFSGQFRFS